MLKITCTTILFVVIGILFADEDIISIHDVSPLAFIIFVTSIPIAIILLLLKDYIFGNKKNIINTHKYKDITESDKQHIKVLAQDFFKKKKGQLNEDDYETFFELVKGNSIEVANNYATNVPYSVREILYSAYLKKKHDLKE